MSRRPFEDVPPAAPPDGEGSGPLVTAAGGVVVLAVAAVLAWLFRALEPMVVAGIVGLPWK